MPRNRPPCCANCTNHSKRAIGSALDNINLLRRANQLPELTVEARICESCWLRNRHPLEIGVVRQRGRPGRENRAVVDVVERVSAEAFRSANQADEAEHGEEAMNEDDAEDRVGEVEAEEFGEVIAEEMDDSGVEEDVVGGLNAPREAVGEEHICASILPEMPAPPPEILPEVPLGMLNPEVHMEELDEVVVLNYPNRPTRIVEEEPVPGTSHSDFTPPVSQKRRRLNDTSSSSSSSPGDDIEIGIRTRTSRSVSDSSSDGVDPNVDGSSLMLRMPPLTESHCFICRNSDPGGRLFVPLSAVLDLWIKMKIYLSSTTRCCSSHLLDERFSVVALGEIEKLENVMKRPVNSNDATRLISVLTEKCSHPSMDFTAYGFQKASEYFTLTGLSKDEFSIVLDAIKGKLNESIHRDPKHALAIFMMYMHLHLSQNLLGVLFSMKQQRISDVIASVRVLLMEHFVPKFLGYQHIRRSDYIRLHHTTLAQKICGALDINAIIILDGTYFYCQKSANYKLQRELWSMHKNRSLAKAMMCVAPDGYILEVEALYKANGENNDASILKDMAFTEGGFMSFFQEGDTVIYDRGFRDCSALIRRLGLKMKMPYFLPKGQKQHTTEEANDSRLTTSLRWVVESANGRLKRRWKLLDDVIENSLLPHLGDFVKIGCALLNAFFTPLKSDGPNDEALATAMLERASMPNLLKELIDDKAIPQTGKINWLPITDQDLEDFPRVTEDDIRQLTFGVYQLKQAKSYTSEHLESDADRSYDLFQANERRIKFPPSDGILKFKMQSRHTSSVQHLLWLHYRKEGEGSNAILGWYCKCKAGARVLGCCAHVTAVVWYLGYARHLPVLKMPAARIGRNLRDARNRPRSPEGGLDDGGENLPNEEVGELGEGLPVLTP